MVVTTISMFEEIYTYNRKTLENYLEVYIQCDLEELKKRDQKGLYSAALKGQIKNVVGVDLSFDEPNTELVIENGARNNLQQKIEKIMRVLG